jgi:hypothetical protein
MQEARTAVSDGRGKEGEREKERKRERRKEREREREKERERERERTAETGTWEEGIGGQQKTTNQVNTLNCRGGGGRDPLNHFCAFCALWHCGYFEIDAHLLLWYVPRKHIAIYIALLCSASGAFSTETRQFTCISSLLTHASSKSPETR